MPRSSDLLKDYLICVSRLPRLQAAELELSLRAWRSGDVAARRRLHEALLGEVLRWVLPYRAGAATFQRLIEAGNRGLAKALADPKTAEASDPAAVLQAQVIAEVEQYLSARPRR